MSELFFRLLSISGLKCLQFPFIDQLTKYSDNNRLLYIQLICWLEDRKIRELEIEEREGIRNDSPIWDQAMQNYLERLACPFQWSDKNVIKILNWLISHSIRLEYEDCGMRKYCL